MIPAAFSQGAKETVATVTPFVALDGIIRHLDVAYAGQSSNTTLDLSGDGVATFDK